MDIEHKVVTCLLFRARIAQDSEPGLVSGTAIEIGQVVVPNEVALVKNDVAFATIHHLIGTRIQYSVDETGAFSSEGGNHPGMHLAFGVARTNRCKHLAECFI